MSVLRSIPDDLDGAEHEYRITPFKGTVGSKYFSDITDAFGGSIFDQLLQAVIEGYESPEGDGLSKDDALVVELANECARRIVDRGKYELIRDLLRQTERDGLSLVSDDTFDTAYCQNYGELEAALGVVLEVNFAGFLLRRFEPSRTTVTKLVDQVKAKWVPLFGALSQGSTARGGSGERGSKLSQSMSKSAPEPSST